MTREATEDRPSPLANENEEKAAQQRAAELRIERRARDLARSQGERAFLLVITFIAGLIAIVAAVGLAVAAVGVAWAMIGWAWDLR